MREKKLFDAAVDGLAEYYPEFSSDRVVEKIKTRVVVPDTGNDQADYESVRDQVERLFQDLLIDGRLLGE